jgi:hypothetical protein
MRARVCKSSRSGRWALHAHDRGSQDAARFAGESERERERARAGTTPCRVAPSLGARGPAYDNEYYTPTLRFAMRHALAPVLLGGFSLERVLSRTCDIHLDFGVVIFLVTWSSARLRDAYRRMMSDERRPGRRSSSGFPPLAPTIQAGQDSWMGLCTRRAVVVWCFCVGQFGQSFHAYTRFIRRDFSTVY